MLAWCGVAHDPGMRRFLLKCLVVVLLAAGGYALWPRHASLSEFSPRGLAELDVAAWRAVVEGRMGAAMIDMYRLYEGEYGLQPVDAFYAAWNAIQAMGEFSRAADRADQEGALPFLENVYGVVTAKTGAPADSMVAARLELFEWMLASDTRRRGELVTAVAEKFAVLHGAPAVAFESPAAALAKGVELRAGRKWGAAVREMETGLEQLKKRLSERNEPQ